MARRLWLAVTSVPLAVAVNDQVLGVSVIDASNGGAGMSFLGGETTPNRCVVLARKQLTFRLLPAKPGDVVITKYDRIEFVYADLVVTVRGFCRCAVDPDRNQALRYIAGENALAYARSGKKYRVRPSRMWLECDVPLRGEDTEDSLLFGGVSPSACLNYWFNWCVRLTL
jgi:hypothetical protein